MALQGGVLTGCRTLFRGEMLGQVAELLRQ